MQEYKRRWEAKCAEMAEAEGDEVDEPEREVYEVTCIAGGTHKLYDFELEDGDELLVTVWADEYIDVYICNQSDYRRWKRSADLSAFEAAEDVRACRLSFAAPRAGTYLVLVVNDGRAEAEVGIDASSWCYEDDCE